MSQVLSLPQIRILPEQLANQIAAGEVVERPASVIKELIENSLDAQATQIDIDVEEGGIKKILVRDNGCGIPQEQLSLAICRHATSKIEHADDLQAIESLGFRGEALASIGSVSRLQLISRIAEESSGWCLSSRNGIEHHIVPIAHPKGTSLEVSDLFYNTPARRKFLRTDRTEFRHLDEVFRRMALGRFDVGFQLKHNHRIVHQLRPALDTESRQRRLHKLFGKAFVQQSSYLDMQASGLRMWGWLSQPEYSRSQADQQYFYVNGRIIRDRIINHAIRQAYQNILYPGRQAAYVLHLELGESLVDVNVHPTKHEVRFRESRLVHDFIFRVVREALSRSGSGVSGGTEPDESHSTYASRTSQLPSRIRETTNVYRGLNEVPAMNGEETPLGFFLTEIQDRFWLLQKVQGLVLLDLSRAHAQVFYQRLVQAERPLCRQPVLVPITLKLAEPQVSLIERNNELLHDWGFDLRITGPQTVMVLHVPAILRGVDVEKLIPDILLHWQQRLPDDPDQIQRQLSELAALHFRYTQKMQNRSRWLEEVAALSGAGQPVWRLLTPEQLEELIQRG